MKSWENIFGPAEIQVEGATPLPKRGTINFTSSVSEPEDDETNERTNVPLGGGGGGGDLAVTGDGVVKVVASVVQSAASKIVNADVATGAAIAVSKLANADTDGKSLRRKSGVLGFGAIDLSNENAVEGLGTDKRVLYNNDGVVAGIAGVTWDGTNLGISVPIGGDSTGPLHNRVAPLATPGGTVTPDATIFGCPEIVITTDTPTTFNLPNVNGAHFFIRNQGAGAQTFKVTGQTGVAVAAGEDVEIFCNGTDYKRAISSSGGGKMYLAFSGSVSIPGGENLTIPIANGTAADTFVNRMGFAVPGACTLTSIKIYTRNALPTDSFLFFERRTAGANTTLISYGPEDVGADVVTTETPPFLVSNAFEDGDIVIVSLGGDNTSGETPMVIEASVVLEFTLA